MTDLSIRKPRDPHESSGVLPSLSQMEELINQSVFPRGKPTDSEAISAVRKQYQLVVEMWDRLRARRQQTNAFYLTINSGLLVATMAIATSKDILVPKLLPFLSIVLALVGFIICGLWFFTIEIYRSLTDRKQQIIIQMEQILPAAPFSAEACSDGAKPILRPFTVVERGVPVAFAFLYAGLLVIHLI